MNNVSHAQALALLGQSLLLEGPCEFLPSRHRPWHYVIEQGLVNRTDSTRAGLTVKLEYVITPKAHLRTWQFGVFKAQLGSPSRVYQLTITSAKKPIKDLHRLSHEHMGDCRSEAQPQWSGWTFEQALTYFCSRTNITIEPPLDNPEHLRLR